MTENGLGMFIWNTGESYVGYFLNGVRTGRGTFRWPDGKVYEGDFLDDTRSGHGKLKWPAGDVYEGDFVNGIFHGKADMGQRRILRRGLRQRQDGRHGRPLCGRRIRHILRGMDPRVPDDGRGVTYPSPFLRNGASDERGVIYAAVRRTSHVCRPPPGCAVRVSHVRPSA